MKHMCEIDPKQCSSMNKVLMVIIVLMREWFQCGFFFSF